MVQIDVAVNAPEAGTIKEFLVNEEDTVTVGQDIVKMELGGSPTASKPEKSDPADEPKSEPQASEKEPKPEAKPESTKGKTQGIEASKASPQPSQQSQPPSKESSSTGLNVGSREERRVSASIWTTRQNAHLSGHCRCSIARTTC